MAKAASMGNDGDTFVKFCKYSLFFVNFLIWALGCTLLGVGIWVRAYRPDYFYYSGVSYLVAAPAIIITCGVIIFVLGLIGCIGITREVPSLLASYAIILLVLVILELAGGIFATDQRQWIYDTMTTAISDVINRYEYDKGDVRLRDMLDYLHKDLQCCGLHSPHDFPSGVPESCKVSWHVNPWEYGCGERLFWMIWLRGGIIGGIGITIAVVQVIGIIFALILSSYFKDQSMGV